MLTNTEELIKVSPPGQALYGQMQVEGQEKETAFFLREETRKIKKLDEPLIQIKFSLFDYNDVMIMPLLVAIGNPDIEENIWETWVNWHNFTQRECLENLAKQSWICFHFYGDSDKKEKSIEVLNSWQNAVKKTIEILSKSKHWEMQDFNIERGKMYAKYPGVKLLWQATE